jgi:hypothetical protein
MKTEKPARDSPGQAGPCDHELREELTMPSQTLKDHVANWELLQATAQPELSDMPHATADLTDLDRLIQAGKDLEVRRAALRESLAKTGRERRDLIQSGADTYRRLSLGLRSKLGPKSETLLRFGVAPQKTPRRSKGSGSTPVESQPPVIPAAPTAKAAEPASPAQA